MVLQSQRVQSFSAPPASAKAPRLAWLEGMRILAAVLILLYHAQLLFTDYAFTPQPTGLWDNWQRLISASHLNESSNFLGWSGLLHGLALPVWFGYQFVDVFVLISGFSLVLSLRNQPLETGRFIKTRLLRLLWPFWTVAWLSYPVLWLVGSMTGTYKPNAWHSFAGTTFPLFFDYRGGVLLSTSGPWWFVPLIISFTLTFPFLWRLLQRWGATNLLLISILVTVGYRALATYALGGHPTYVILETPALEKPFQVFLAKLSTFVVGMVVGQAFSRGKGPIFWSQRRSLLIGLVFYTMGWICQFYTIGWVVADLLLPLGLTLLCMVAMRSLACRKRIQSWMTKLGSHSYSYFLIHNLVIDLTLRLVVEGDRSLYYWLLPVMVVGTLLLAMLADYSRPVIQSFVTKALQRIDQFLTQSHLKT